VPIVTYISLILSLIFLVLYLNPFRAIISALTGSNKNEKHRIKSSSKTKKQAK
jgi:hypothetical protein